MCGTNVPHKGFFVEADFCLFSMGKIFILLRNEFTTKPFWDNIVKSSGIDLTPKQTGAIK